MAVTQAQVAQLYVALFNRAPEGAGFNAWVNAGANSTIAQMANDMLSSPAAQSYFNGSIDHDRDFVEMLYKNILGKDYNSDPDGINSWVKHLQLGNSRGDTVAKLFEVATSDIAKAADPVAAKTFENKTAISEYMAQKIADIPADQSGAYDYSLFQEIIASTNNTNLEEQKARIDALIAPTIHNLSPEANDVSGSDKSDIFNGAVSATVGQTTFKSTDKLDGKGGEDTLNLDLYTNFYGMTNGVGEVKNIENLNLTNKTNGDLRFDTKYIHNLETITLNGENKIDVINPENKVKLIVNDLSLSGSGDTGRLNLIYNTDVLAGSNDDQEITVNNVTMDDSARINITTVNGDNIEALTINAVGGASRLTKFTSNSVRQGDQTASIKTMHIKGTADLTVDTTDGLYTFDASEYKGTKLVANVKANQYVQSIKGSASDDVFNVTSASGRIIPIDGGAGRDTVNFISSISGNQHVEMTGVEVLNINTNASTLDFSRAQEITELGINGTNANVTILNSKITTVNANATNLTGVTINNSSEMKDFNVTRGASATLTANGTEKINVKVANASTVPATQGTSSTTINSNTVKELNFNLDSTTTSSNTFTQTLNNVLALETLNVVNNTDKNLVASITAANARDDSGNQSNNTNAFKLKTLNVETKGDYYVTNKLSGISQINLKGTGDTTSVTLAGQIGDTTYGPVPLQGVQDINLKAEGLKALSTGKILTTRDVNLTSTTDKEDSSVTYGEIGDRATEYKVNNVTINASGQKTLTTGNISAVGDVNLTANFAQNDFAATLGSAGGGIIARNLTINQSANSGLTGGAVTLQGAVAITNDLNVTASGYETFNLGSSAMQIGGAANINTTATKAQSATIVQNISGVKNGITVTARANSGINDATLRYGNLTADAKDINITTANQKTVTIGNVRAEGNTAATRGDVNISTTTSIADSSVTVGEAISAGKGVTLNFSGQKTLNVGNVSASMANGDANVTVATTFTDATATFNGIVGKNVNLNVNNLKTLTVSSVIQADDDVNINTGTNNYLETASIPRVEGKNITMDVSNVTQPLNAGSPVTVVVKNNLTIKGYAGDAVSDYGISILANAADQKDFVANLTNVKGTIGGVGTITETVTVKGSVTNPDSLLSAGQNSDLTFTANNLTALKTIDFSGYTNASGTTTISTNVTNSVLETVKGATTKSNINIDAVNLKLVEGGAGDDTVTFGSLPQNNDVKVNLGAGDDTITTAALTGDKKFEISGGAGNDTFNLSLSTTDANASKYVTITDINRGDKINLGGGVTTLQKITANVESAADLKTAINTALSSLSSTNANTIYAISYGNETYLVREGTADKTLGSNDNLVKLAGLSNFDLFNGNIDSTGTLTVTNA